MTDSIGRSWQLGTVQLDYYMPEQFELAYTGADNAEHRPVMIHRALMGSFERFIGILIEHYAGEFPLWLAPVQALVLPIADRHVDYAREVARRAARAGLRVEVDDRTESVGRKIRDAELRKVPYMLVVGDEEAEAGQGRRAPPPRGRPGRGAGRRVRPRRAQARGDGCRASLYSPAYEGHPHHAPLLSARALIAFPVYSLCRLARVTLVPIPRRFDRRPPERDETRINERIRVPRGAPDRRRRQPDRRGRARDEALRYAQERDLDLVEVAAEARPPVCRVLDYSKYKYEQEQKAKAARRHQKQVNVREIKLRPKIADNDYETKKNHVVRFLKGDDRVKVTIMFRGREQTHPERGERLLLRLAEDVAELGHRRAAAPAGRPQHDDAAVAAKAEARAGPGRGRLGRAKLPARARGLWPRVQARAAAVVQARHPSPCLLWWVI